MDNPSALAGPDQMAGVAGQPVVFLANDWRTDPTSKHHVAREMARHTDVVWVEASGMRIPKLHSPQDLARVWKKVRGGGRKAEVDRDPDGIHVLSPLAVPLPGVRWAERHNARVYRRTIGNALERRGLTRLPLLWVYIPTTEPYLEAIPHDGLVYHCVDRWWEFSEYDADVMRHHHAQLCRKADVVFASSAGLVEDCEPFTPNVHLIRHGVDWEHFASAALTDLAVPPDLADITGPVLGFFGLIHDWIDQSMIAAVADAVPEATVVLLGKARVDTSELDARSNVRLLGQKPYAELPAYAARFDVGLIPFVINELTEAVNPIKLREYLSAGLPVVATPLPEIGVYEDDPRVWIADGAEAFVVAVRAAMETASSAGTRRAAARSMVNESWAGRTAEMVRIWRSSR